MLIKIMFKIFNSYIEDDDDLKGEYGYFQLCVNDKTYGEYRDDIELDILSMNIYDWFCNLAQAFILLKNNSAVYISDVDTSEVWIKMMIDNDNIRISEIYADKPEGSSSVETDINLNEINEIWGETVKLQEYQKELVLKGEQYLSEMKNLNSRNNEYILKFETELEKMR